MRKEPFSSTLAIRDFGSAIGNDSRSHFHCAFTIEVFGDRASNKERKGPETTFQRSFRGANWLLTVSEVAALLSVKKSNIYYWSSRGEIPVIDVGRCLRFDATEVLEHFKKVTKDAKRVSRSKSLKQSDIRDQICSLKTNPPKSIGRSKKE